MENEVKVQEGKDVQFTDEQLAQMIEQNAELQQNETKEVSVKADYIILAKDGTKALKRSNKELYIEGLQMGDLFIQNDKKNLGPSLEVVPLAFITVYNERESADQNAKFCGIWNSEQASTFPLVEGSWYNRQLPNGHILVPSHWVMVEVLGHPEIENAVITYKSTGSRIYKAWLEDAVKRAKSTATLIYTIGEEVYSNKDHEWTDIGYNFTGSLLERDKKQCFLCVQKSSAIRDSYKKHVLFADRTVENNNVAALPEKSANEVEDSYDDEEVGF